MTDTIWVMNLETLRFDYISPSVVRSRGFTAEEARSQSLAESVSPESLERVTRIMVEELTREEAGDSDPDRSRTIELEPLLSKIN